MLQGQFGYGPEDLWVNGGVPFTSASATTTTHNNNAYFVGQVSVPGRRRTYVVVLCLNINYLCIPNGTTQVVSIQFSSNIVQVQWQVYFG